MKKKIITLVQVDVYPSPFFPHLVCSSFLIVVIVVVVDRSIPANYWNVAFDADAYRHVQKHVVASRSLSSRQMAMQVLSLSLSLSLSISLNQLASLNKFKSIH